MRKLLTFDPSIRSSSSLSLSPLCLFDPHTDFGSAVMVVIVVWKFPGYPSTSFMCPFASSSSSSLRLKVARLNGSLDLFFLDRPVVWRLPMDAPSPVGGKFDPIVDQPSLDAIFRKSGRMVARLPAVIAKPCSTVDQIAMSIVAPTNCPCVS